MTEPTNTEAKAKKSLTEQLIEAKARVARIEAKIAAAAIINNVSVGDDVGFLYGRSGLGDGRRELRGKVVATGETDLGLKVRIEVGSGIEAETRLVFAREIVTNFTKGINVAEAAAADDEDDTVTDAKADATNPLAAE